MCSQHNSSTCFTEQSTSAQQTSKDVARRLLIERTEDVVEQQDRAATVDSSC